MLKAAICYFLAISLFTGNTVATDAPITSDFIDNLPALRPSTLVNGFYEWEATDASLSHYDRFIIDEIDIFIHPEFNNKGVNAIDLLTLTSSLRGHLIDALEHPATPWSTNQARASRTCR